MATTRDLSKRRTGTVLNLTSKLQETIAADALGQVVRRLEKAFPVQLRHDKTWHLASIIERLRAEYPDVPFADVPASWHMKPDGGILSMVDKDGETFPILIMEVKNQGTNDRREKEEKSRQSMGNAIERMGKNVIGFRTAMLPHGIMPFVCFGYGCDFAENSYIRGRAITVAMFGPLNEISVVPPVEGSPFSRGSFFIREKPWSKREMANRMFDVAERSVHFYYAKYGSKRFQLVS
jgi:type II restriction enzyme